MAKIKTKYYVVWEGVNPGIYDSWAACQLQIKGYPQAKYKSYKTLKQAELAFDNSYDDRDQKTDFSINDVPYADKSICVDAACSGNPGLLEYRGVYTITKKEIFRIGPLQHGTNNIGEYLALVHGLALLKKAGQEKDIAIYSDSKTAMSWVRNKKVKTTLKRTSQNKPLFELIERANKWLSNHDIVTTIIKWDTENWGEIPADFGRK